MVLSEIRDISKLATIAPLNNYLNLRNRDDYHILEAAYSAKVNYLITRDKDFLSLNLILDLKIFSPDEFLIIQEEQEK